MVSLALCPASSRTSFSSVVCSAAVRRRLPIVGAICVLAFGFSNLCHSPFKTGCAQSLSFPFPLRSKEQSRSIHSIKMEASTNTVPSIVVYVTVPNKEAGHSLSLSLFLPPLSFAKSHCLRLCFCSFDHLTTMI